MSNQNEKQATKELKWKKIYQPRKENLIYLLDSKEKLIAYPKNILLKVRNKAK